MKFEQVNQKSKATSTSVILEKLSERKLNDLKNIVNKKTFLILIIVFIVFCTFIAGVIMQRNYGFSNFIAKPIIQDPIGISKRKIQSFFASPDILRLDLKYKDYMKLMHTLEKVRESKTSYGVDNEWVNADLQNKNISYRAKIRLKGATADEHAGDKWSFKIKLKDQKTIHGMREFAVMSPVRRNYLGMWFIRKVYEKEGIISRKYDFINLIINGEDKGIYVMDERYDKIMLERNHRKEGPVIKIDQTPLFVDKVEQNIDRDNYYFSMDLTAFDVDSFLEDEVSRAQFMTAKNLMDGFRFGKIKTSEVFDIKLLAKWTAITDVMGAWHGFTFPNMRFYFNPVISKFEPIPDDDFNERSFNYSAEHRKFRLTDQYNNSSFLRQLFSDQDFVEEYMKQLLRISDNNYLDSLFVEFNDEINELSKILAIDYPLYSILLDSKINIYDNAKKLRDNLFFHKGIQAHLKAINDNENVEIIIANNHTIPMEVLYISDTDSRPYMPVNKEKLVIDGRKFMSPVIHNTYLFEPPYLDNNFNKNSPNLSVTYRVIGTKKLFNTKVFPYREFNSKYIGSDFIRMPYNIDSFSFIEWDKSNNEIRFKKGNWQITSDLIIPPNQTLIIPEGSSIDLVNTAMILSYSPILIVGSEENYTEIFSSDNSGQGITVLNSEKDSLIKYVEFKGLSRPKKPGFELTGAVNFYESPVHFFEAHFDSNIKGDDYVNIIRSDFTINQSSISNSFSDAIDIDFSNGSIFDSFFSNCGFGNNNGDCIDLSGSVVEIDKINIKKSADKGISIGEQSIVKIKNSSIEGSNIAIASKDLSETTINDLVIKSSKVGISVFQKKAEFGPATVVINGLNIDSVQTPYLVEEASFLSVNSISIK